MIYFFFFLFFAIWRFANALIVFPAFTSKDLFYSQLLIVDHSIPLTCDTYL